MKMKGTIWSYLFKPFRYIAGKESLFVGIGVLLMLSVLGYLTNTNYDGVLDMHYGCETERLPYGVHALFELIAWFSLVAVLYPVAKIFSSSSVRPVDMAGTLAMARFPLVFGALLGLNPGLHTICTKGISLVDEETIASIVQVIEANRSSFLWAGLFSIPLIIWYIVLLYNAYSVSANLKGERGGWSFAMGLIISEILAQILIHLTAGFL
ncbi:MAG: hypothetical protein LBJ72_10040 [Dysgonamonadaceae bacterium]|jgi:hypothetical protein|nr:hypothetical protein [Dysgonamonadaceae bacterium]